MPGIYAPESQRASVIIFNLESAQIRKAPLSTIRISGSALTTNKYFPSPKSIWCKKSLIFTPNAQKAKTVKKSAFSYTELRFLVDGRNGNVLVKSILSRTQRVVPVTALPANLDVADAAGGAGYG